MRLRPSTLAAIFLVAFTVELCANPSGFQTPISSEDGRTTNLLPYKQTTLSVDERVRDLIGRMTIEEKVRQLDMYSGSSDLLDADQRIDETHAKADAAFNPERAIHAFGNLGVGSIHDLYPSPQLCNAVQSWIMKSTRLGIPALFIEEGLHGYMAPGETVFPQSVNLASTWDPELARRTGAAIASEARANGVDMILAPVLDVARDPLDLRQSIEPLDQPHTLLSVIQPPIQLLANLPRQPRNFTVSGHDFLSSCNLIYYHTLSIILILCDTMSTSKSTKYKYSENRLKTASLKELRQSSTLRAPPSFGSKIFANAANSEGIRHQLLRLLTLAKEI